MITENDIIHAYDRLKNALVTASMIGQKMIDHKTALDNKIATAIVNGVIQGKNETERKAQADCVFADELQELRDLQRDNETARLTLELAQNEVAMVRALLRLEEVLAKVTPEVA